MSRRHVMRLPDLGEGTVSAEVIAWKVRPGDVIREDAPLVEMSTEKAVVEVPSPVSGRVLSVQGAPGEVIAVGAELAVFEVEGEAPTATATAAATTPVDVATSTPASASTSGAASPSRNSSASAVRQASTTSASARVLASPATRRRASEAGIDLSQVRGTGPQGRILADDLDATRTRMTEVEERPVIGVRRVIAERMAEAKRAAPHFSYVEEVDVTELEMCRQQFNLAQGGDTPGLTYLPVIARALALTLQEFPQCNAHYDAARNVVVRFKKVHLGIATQTPDGLKVPVVRDVLAHDLVSLAAEIRRVTEAARSGRARREELSGSSITLTSLGKLGGIVSTPILNLPEVAIIGVNKALERVVVHDGAMGIRRMMNLSSSFDHRFVDGFDAAAMIQNLKARLEKPANLFDSKGDIR